MDGAREVLFSGKPRRKRDERQLTEEVARICESDAGLRAGFALALARVVDSKRSRSLASRLGEVGGDVVVEGQHDLGRVRTKAFREAGGKPDWVIYTPKLVLVVEAKIEAGLQKKQLHRYLKHPQLVSGEAEGGLILLTENKVKKMPLRIRIDRHWLGQITWRQLIPQLEQIEATNSTNGDHWRAVLEAVQQEGDLGDGAILWRRGRRTIAQRNRMILKSVTLHASHVLDRTLRDHFENMPVVDTRAELRVTGKHRADLDLFIPRAAKLPAITVSVHGQRRPLAVTLTVHGITRAVRGDDGTAARARRELRKANFDVTSDDCTITKRFGARQQDNDPSPTEALRIELDPLLSTIGTSGALDGRVNRWGRYHRKT